MANTNPTATRIQARDAAMRTLNRVTAGVAFGAVAGVGMLGVVSAHTIPGVSSSSQTTTASASTSKSSTSSSLQSSSSSVSSSSSSGVAVSGGS